MRKRAEAPYLTCKTAVLCWNPRHVRERKPSAREVLVTEFGKGGDDGQEFSCTCLAPFAVVHKMTFAQRKALVFIEAVHLMVRDGCDPQAVHRELLKIEEYQDGLSEDSLWYEDGT